MKKTCLLTRACILILVAFNVTVSAQIENLPWGVERIRADQVWDTDWTQDFIVNPGANAGQRVRVAVIDTGIANHPDLTGRVVDGISYVEGKQYWEDDVGHGTHVAGTIAAIDNGDHLIGVAPRVDLYAVKVDPYYIEQVVGGIYWAVSKAVHIISMSLGYPATGNYPSLKEACDYAYSQGVLLIAASGNEADPVSCPAIYETVVAVGATYSNDKRWEWSNYGYPELEFAAPGVDVNSTLPPNKYQEWRGTSQAVPHVTGAAALVFASKVDAEYDSNGNGQWDNFEVREKLRDTALDLGRPGKDGYYGYGLVNAWYSNQRPPGDINYDLIVDMGDISIINYFFGITPEDPDWWYGRRADIDNIIWARDRGIAGRHFGEIDP
jgi:subtilisin family serine protease